MVLLTCNSVRLAWKWTLDEGKKAVRLAENWAEGKKGVTLNNIRDAARAAFDATYAYAAYDAVFATYAAAYAAYDAVYAAHAANAASAAYAHAATDAAYVAARKDILKKCAIIVRKEYPKAPKI